MFDGTDMYNSSRGLVTAAMARVKTGLAVYLGVIEEKNLLTANGLFLGSVTRR